MWSDTFLALERSHLIRVSAWAAGTVIAGSLLVVWLVVRRRAAPLLMHFAAQMALWGAIELIFTAVAWRMLVQRDFSSAMQLQHTLWLNTGLDLGGAGIGLTLAGTSFYLGRNLSGVGAGFGVATHALALLLLNVQFLTLIGPMR